MPVAVFQRHRIAGLDCLAGKILQRVGEPSGLSPHLDMRAHQNMRRLRKHAGNILRQEKFHTFQIQQHERMPLPAFVPGNATP